MKNIQCISSKKTFFSQSEAEQRRDEINKSGAKKNGLNVEMRSYQCDACGYWHLTTMDRESFKSHKERTMKIKERKISLEAAYWEERLR